MNPRGSMVLKRRLSNDLLNKVAAISKSDIIIAFALVVFLENYLKQPFTVSLTLVDILAIFAAGYVSVKWCTIPVR